MAIDLKDIVPQPASFKLSLMPDVVFNIRPIALSDELWLANEFGDKLETILKRVEMVPVCRIIFHQLQPESQKLLKATTVTIQNEQGEEVSKKLGGVELLLACISGVQEKFDVYNALMETFGISRPLRDKMLEEEKKSLELELNRRATLPQS